MFVQSLEQISKKIASSKNKEQGFKILEKKIMTNPVLRNQFEVYSTLKESTNKIKKPAELKEFSIGIKEKCVKFKEQIVNDEVIKLLEFFNINPTTIKSTIMDKAMHFDNVSLKKVVLNEKRKLLVETYKQILTEDDEAEFKKQIRIIKFNSESKRNEKRRDFINQSLSSLLEERYKNYNACIKKLYKLRLLTEDIIDDESEKSQYGGGKKVAFKDLTYIKRITVEVPEMFKKPEKIIINFHIPVFPIGATDSAVKTSAILTKIKLNKLERQFINLCIYSKGRTNLFEPVGTIWDVILKMQASIGSKQNAKFTIFLNTNPDNDGVNTWQMFYKAAYEMLKEFNQALPELMGEYANVLTSTAQKEVLNQSKGLSKPEKEKQANLKGMVNRDLMKRKLGSQEVEDAEKRVDDFSGAF